MPEPTPSPTMAEHTLTITRVLDAPRELVWKAWTDPTEFAKWFGPEGFRTPEDSVTIDPRPGGVFRSTMVGPDGTEYPSDGTFREVDEPERLVAGEDEIDSPMMERTENVLTFTDLGDGRTELKIEATMVCTEELPAMAELGWGTTLDKLAALLADR